MDPGGSMDDGHTDTHTDTDMDMDTDRHTCMLCKEGASVLEGAMQ